jgi:hypothetical protein
MGLPTVHLTLVPDTRVARDLSAGGVFVHGCELAVNEQCELVVKTPIGEMRLEARVVYIDGRGGAGLELVGFGATMKTQLAALIARGPEPEIDAAALDESIDTLDMEMSDLAAPAYIVAGPVPLDDIDEPTTRRPSRRAGQFDLDAIHNFEETLRVAPPLAGEEIGEPATTHAADGDPPADRAEPAAEREPAAGADDDDAATATADPQDFDDLWANDPAAEDFEDAAAAEPNGEGEPFADFLAAGTEEQRKVAKSIHERLRGLPLAEQIKKANSSDPSERIMLERIYGKTVWEPLLRNSRLTAPEVARIARMGALPKPLLEVIVGNGGWVQVPEVRRALLSNPRLGADQILRVLRLMPKHELKLCATQTVYPYAVRDAAKRLVRG